MLCSSCGVVSSVTAKFCNGCGKSFKEAEYYVHKLGSPEPFGPLNETELKKWLSEERIAGSDSIAKVGDQNWTPISNTSFASLVKRKSPPVVNQAPSMPLQQQQYQQMPPQYAQMPPMQPFPVAVVQTNNQVSDVGRMMMFEANKKSAGVAYLLWFFLGGFGAHRFYLGESGTGAAILIITLGSIFLSVIFIGILTIWISIIWIFVDLFLIPGMVQRYNSQLAARLNV